MENIVEITSATVQFDEKLALDQVSFSIASGDFIGLIGANGAGKSTLLNALVGLQTLNKGAITYSDSFLAIEKTPFSMIGFSPQQTIMDFYTTVWDNIKLGLDLSFVNKANYDAYLDKVFNLLDLESIKDKSVDSLSGGQLQRVQIARAIVHQPHLYILDEPTSSLDIESSEHFLDFLKKEVSKTDKAVIVSSHDISSIERFCNKILLLKEGRVLYFGTREQLLQEDKHVFHITSKNTFSKEQLSFLEQMPYSYQLISDNSCQVTTPKTVSMPVFFKYVSQVIELSDISQKQSQLREQYLKINNPTKEELIK